MAANELMMSSSFMDHKSKALASLFSTKKKPINVAGIKGNSWQTHTVVGPRRPEHRQDICYPRHHTSIGLPQTCTVDAKRPDEEMKSKLLEEKIGILIKHFANAGD